MDFPSIDGLFRARFVSRPNRFLVKCESDTLNRVTAFMPNPGRLWELLLPGVELLVRKAPPARTGQKRKTAYTVLGVDRDGESIFLDTHLNNQVARSLLEARRIPGLENATVVRSEVPLGRSRFDFLLEEHGRDLYLEVKSCTLFGNGVAMFPDAVTERGRRHVLELSHLAKQGTPSAVLFLVHSRRVDWFMPDYHTDPAFAEAMLQVRQHVRILPVSIGWTPDLRLEPGATLLTVPWDHVAAESKDRGAYLLSLHLKRTRAINVGKLGRLRFPAGHYLYVGSAMKNLTARVARHVNRRKNMHWHIDYLRECADNVTPIPIRTSKRIECDLASDLGAFLAPGPPGFGSSDCDCPGHLFHTERSPFHLPRFHDVLQTHRMRTPD